MAAYIYIQSAYKDTTSTLACIFSPIYNDRDASGDGDNFISSTTFLVGNLSQKIC